MRRRLPGLQDEFTGTVNRLAASPLTVGLSGRRVVLDGYTFTNLVIQQSLAPGNYAGLPALIHSTATGDGVPAATRAARHGDTAGPHRLRADVRGGR